MPSAHLRASAAKSTTGASALEKADTFIRSGHFAAAEPLLRAVVRRQPDNAQGWHLLGLCLSSIGQPEAGRDALLEAVRRAPDQHAFFFNLGVIYERLEQRDLAAVSYRRVLTLKNDHVEAWYRLGQMLFGTRNLKEAEAAFRAANLLSPGRIEALYMLALVLHEQHRYEEALHQYNAVLAADPNHVRAMIAAGAILQVRADFSGAAVLFERALALAPENPKALTNLATCRYADCRNEDALSLGRRAMALSPDSATCGNFATVLLDLERFDEAAPLFETALTLDPDNAAARQTRGVMRLMQGDLVNGWDDYEWRFRTAHTKMRFNRYNRPIWQGPASGKTVFMWAEQGIGDEIFFGSMIPDVAALGLAGGIECDPRLVPLFARSFPGIPIYPRTEPQPVADIADNPAETQAAFGSLGQWLRPSRQSFPQRPSFLVPERERRETLRRALTTQAGGNRIVGLSWRTRNRRRCTPDLDLWHPILRIPGITFVNLQYGECAADLARWQSDTGANIIQAAEVDLFDDMDGLAALCSAVDLVVSIDNVTVHMAAAVGTPTWTLLPRGGGVMWYWGVEGDTTAWYPKMRLLRQETPGDWSSLLQRAGADLARLPA